MFDVFPSLRDTVPNGAVDCAIMTLLAQFFIAYKKRQINNFPFV
jgi:hypothetical protein